MRTKGSKRQSDLITEYVGDPIALEAQELQLLSEEELKREQLEKAKKVGK